MGRPAWRAAEPALQVSGRNTIGASRPLAPCTVMTRTSLRPCSMSRLISRVPCAQRGEEARERGRRVVVVGQREVQELVERVGGVGSQAREQLRAHAVAVEEGGEELVGRREVGGLAPALQGCGGLGVARLRARIVEERLPKRALAPVGAAPGDRRRRDRRAGSSGPRRARGRPRAASGNRRARSGPRRRSARRGECGRRRPRECRVP